MRNPVLHFGSKFQLVIAELFVLSIEGTWDHIISKFFKNLWHNAKALVSASTVSNDLDKYLPKHSIFKDCIESDVHYMTSQIYQF